MALTLEITDAAASIVDQEKAIRQREQLGFRLLSLAIGRVRNQPANLVTFQQTLDGPPDKQITLVPIDGALTRDGQEDALNTTSVPVVCYGALLVNGTRSNVAAVR